MAREIAEINESIIAAKEAQPELAVLDSTSKVSIWRLWAYVTAVCIWTLENLFDLHKAEVNTFIESTRSSYVPDLRNRILNFQYGYDLVQDEIYYDNTGLTDDAITASKVVKYVAMVELTRGLLVKVAGITGGDLAPLTTPQKDSLTQYLARIKPPGVGIKIVNKVADSLKLSIDIYYNPLILDETGKRRDGSNDTPIQKAIQTFLENQPFNGQYIITRQERAIEAVDGVVIAKVSSSLASYESVGFLPFEVLYLPDSGYLRFASPGDLALNFIPHENL